MQSLTWYRQRLGAMSPGEVWWRAAVGLRGCFDRCAHHARQDLLLPERLVDRNGRARRELSDVFGACFPAVERTDVPIPGIARWRSELAATADRLIDNRHDLFDLQDHALGRHVRWNHEYAADRPTPMGYAPSIDYRDYSVTGDAKVVWELNRHHHLSVLGRAYRLLGERRYAEKVVQDIDSWIEQCPYGCGMNWRSPLELAIRMINWVWALELIRPSGAVSAEFRARVLPVAYRHLWEISRNYSRHSSANNHLIGEAAGVFIGCCFWGNLKPAQRWEARSREILMTEILEQTHPDGGHAELSMGYHLFVVEFFLLAGLAARNSGRDFPPAYWDRLSRMIEFVATFAEGGESVPMFNDCDDGRVLDLGDADHRARGLLSIGAAVFERPRFKRLSGGFQQTAFWLLGEGGLERYERIDPQTDSTTLQSCSLPDSGFYLLQCGAQGSPESMSVTFDCGALGMGSIAAHGHADALSFTLRVGGADVLVDPGTYDYFSHPKWRDYFRSTGAHNTIVVDDENQSEMLGLFLWRRRATARCLDWAPVPGGGTVVGEHDGYHRLADPVTHRRRISLDGDQGLVTIDDRLESPSHRCSAAGHSAALHLHLAEHCTVHETTRNHYAVQSGQTRLWIDLDSRLETSVYRGSEDPILGWVSRGYHRKQPTATIVGRCTWTGMLSLITRIGVAK
ncbi:MAG: alginate lyase family protein [Planctomycetes bacterium]|nr:alginate lyase family protein [Planctomycetota bacterium]